MAVIISSMKLRCGLCGSTGAYTSFSTAECLNPRCKNFSEKLARDPFTLDSVEAAQYLYAIKCLRNTPDDDTASKKKFRWTIDALLNTKTRVTDT